VADEPLRLGLSFGLPIVAADEPKISDFYDGIVRRFLLGHAQQIFQLNVSVSDHLLVHVVEAEQQDHL
jgi:hypothetical protein